MKKIMTAFAVAGLSSAVFADVTSANVVGYMNRSATFNKRTMTVMPFIPVGGDAASGKLGDFKVVGNNHNPIAIHLWVYDGAGVKTDYCYFDKEATEDEFTPGWYKMNGMAPMIDLGPQDELVDLSLGCGCTLFSSDNKELAHIVYSGQVDDVEREIGIVFNNRKYTGNFLPKSITLEQLKPVYNNHNPIAIKLWFYNNDGAKTGEYCYFDKEATEDEFTPGWYKMNGMAPMIDLGPQNFTIEASDGFIVFSTDATGRTKLSFPKAL